MQTPMTNEKKLARITITIEVNTVTDTGANTPHTHTSPSEHISIAKADVDRVEALSDTTVLDALNDGIFEHPDPDGVLLEAIHDALYEIAPQETD